MVDLCAGGKDPFDTQHDRHDDLLKARLGLLLSNDPRNQVVAAIAERRRNQIKTLLRSEKGIALEAVMDEELSIRKGNKKWGIRKICTTLTNASTDYDKRNSKEI